MQSRAEGGAVEREQDDASVGARGDANGAAGDGALSRTATSPSRDATRSIHRVGRRRARVS